MDLLLVVYYSWVSGKEKYPVVPKLKIPWFALFMTLLHATFVQLEYTTVLSLSSLSSSSVQVSLMIWALLLFWVGSA